MLTIFELELDLHGAARMHLPEKDVEQMAGYTALRKKYDHRKGVDFLKAAQRMRDVINKISVLLNEAESC